MKLKVLTIIKDGVIAANKSNIVCFSENSLRDDRGEDALYHSDKGIYPGQILNSRNYDSADSYWWYTNKEWDKMNDSFQALQK